MLQVFRARNVRGKFHMRHIIFHDLLVCYQNVVQVNIPFYRTRMICANETYFAMQGCQEGAEKTP